jgi:hypothetical protein
MKPKQDMRVDLAVPQQQLPPAERRLFLATDRFCEIWGDLLLVQPGDLVEVATRRFTRNNQSTVITFGWKKVTGIPTGHA